MVLIAHPTYALHSISRLKWTATQEKTLCREYPFVDLDTESPDQFVQRTYLQFLWLPESIMPLHLLVPSMLRINVASSSQSLSTTLPALLDQLLLSVRSTSNKYHIELPQILSDGGGAGETEENMMWFALNYEKAEADEHRTRLSDATHADGPWVDEAWRKRWLERLERREIQIQILLHLLKISLPGPTLQDLDTSSSPSKNRICRNHEPTVVVPSVEERLESFMDKLSTWQLLGSLDLVTTDQSKLRTSNGHTKEDRDWMQVFCEDLVETQFKSKLPELCALFRTKVFPNSPFTDELSSDSLSRSSSPMLVDNTSDSKVKPPQQRQGSSSNNPSHSRHLSPAPSTTSTSHKHTTERSASAPFPRSRSRSLSVSLAHDADTRRAGSVGVGAVTKRRALNREVSMSRVFKDKSLKKVVEGKAKSTSTSISNAMADLKPQGQVGQGVTLVAATPVKGPTSRRAQIKPTRLFASARISCSPTLGGATDGIHEEEDWSLASSPDVLLLGAGSGGVDGMLGGRPFGEAGHLS